MSDDAKRSVVEKECLRILDEFMAALNAHDAGAMDRCMHFPHPRIADSRVIIYHEPGGNPMDLFDRLKQADGWSYSRWNNREVTQFNDSKAHVALSYTRYRDDDSIIGVYESLYVLTKVGGRWGIQARSSFGP